MEQMITKAVIPAAGLGTRFLPATKTQPKEMLPIVDKPAIQFVVEEAVSSGIEDIIVVTGRGKRAIEDYFDDSPELENYLTQHNKLELLAEVKEIASLADIHYVRQKEPKGLGDAVLTAEKHVGKEPFAVLLGDDIIRSDVPCLQQLTAQFERFDSSIIAVEQVPMERLSKYGVIKAEKIDEAVYKIEDIIEKPSSRDAPSSLGTVGRYILTPQIFSCIKHVPVGKNDELQLTDALKALLRYETVYAYRFEGKRYDAGDKCEYVKAIIDFALERDSLRGEILKHLREIPL